MKGVSLGKELKKSIIKRNAKSLYVGLRKNGVSGNSGVNKTMNNSDELKNRILLNTIQQQDPTLDSYVKIGLSTTKKSTINGVSICLEESELIRSFLVPVEKKDIIFKNCYYGDFFGDTTYFDDEGMYHTNETFEERGVIIENIVYHRYIPEMGLSYFEPSERFILYHNLHRTDDIWIKPYDLEKIIYNVSNGAGWHPHNNYITIRKSELKDYLAARKCGLVMLRYVECICYSDTELSFLPTTFRNETTEYGHKSFYNDGKDYGNDKFRYFSRLWDSFWIEPASEPRRWDYRIEGELKGEVEFTFGDGEEGTFFDPINGTQSTEKSEARFFQVISMNPRVLNYIKDIPGHKIKFHSLTNLDIIFPDGQILSGCINSKKQFQTFFGDIAKLSRDKQRHLAGFSEPEKGKLSPEYIMTYIDAKFPPTIPFEDILSKCLESVNKPWLEKFGETLLLSPKSEEIPIGIRLGCLSNTNEELVDIMLELRKIIIPESKIDLIKKQIDRSKHFTNATDYQNAKSIAFIRNLFEHNTFGIDANSPEVLQVIEKLRSAKSHPKDIPKILSELGFNDKEPLEIHYIILSKLSKFLIDFKTLTILLLKTTFDENEEWNQIHIAKNYFEKPF